jgi:hypothetical protein
MAQAKRKNITKWSRRPAGETKIRRLHKAADNRLALRRMEHLIATLESCFVMDGWHEKWKSGPMPKLAVDAVSYLRARTAGARENAGEEAKLHAFVSNCGQSLDWLFGGDVRGLICKAASNSPQSASLSKPSETSAKAQELQGGLSDLETPLCQVRHLALAARMMGTSDAMPKEEGAALDTVADKIVSMVDELKEERERLWRLSREVAFPE